MPSNRDAKDIRKQVRNVAQEIMPEIFSNEAVAALDKKLSGEIGERLDRVEKYVKETLTSIDTRTRNIQGFLLRDVAREVSDKLHNANVTLLAWQELMQEKLVQLNVTGDAFNKELDERKVAVQQRLEAEAVARQQEKIKAVEAQKVMADNQAAQEQAVG